MDYVIVITTLIKIRMERALARETLSREEILKRIDLQWPEEEKIALADFVVHNDGTEKTYKAGDAYSIQPGHDGWVVGDEPVVAYEFHGMWGE